MNKGLQQKWSNWLFVVGIVCMIMGLMLLASAPTIAQDDPEYVGVNQCNDCHRDSADSQKLSAHAHTLIDPVKNPELIYGDFSQANPILEVQLSNEDTARAITLDDIAYALGSGRRIQEYLVEVAPHQYRVLPIAWNIETGAWEKLALADDNWNTQCASCHTTGYDASAGDWVDNAVECESCHGAGGTHADLVDAAGWDIDETERSAIRAAIIAEPDAQVCESCHNSNLNDGIHQATFDFITGKTILPQVTGKATAHATAEGAPDCISCHMSKTVTDGTTQTNHDMLLTQNQMSSTCTGCHTELTVAYAERFITEAETDSEQRLATIENALNSEAVPAWVLDAVNMLEADGSHGVHNVAYTDALLNAVEVQLGLVEQTTLFSVTAVSNPTDCAKCHSDEYAEWLNSPHAMASLNEHFETVYSENGQPTYCLRCHASGFDSETQSIKFEGVVCSNCHQAQTEHPPAPMTMGTNISTCALCHSGGHASVYEEWLASKHSDVGVDCVDCHNAHTNKMLLGDVNTTCADCHADAMQDKVHMGANLICTDCHMTPRQTVNDPTMLTQTGHAMEIDPSVCSNCHGAIHNLTPSTENENGETVNIESLHEEVDVWKNTAEDNLNSGLIGGAVGVLLLLGLIYLVLRLGRSS